MRDIPPPEGDPEGPLQALIIDSWFDNYLGVVSLIRIKNGTLRKGDKVKVMSTGQTYNADRLGIFTPKQVDRTELKCGEVGWLVCAIKDIHGAPVGDTLTLARNPAEKALPGFKKVKPQVYAGLFPVSSDDYEAFRDALGKLSLNDASLFYEPESSSALGFGFRCGFLGLLHMEIIQERLEREYDLDLITTAPTVVYEVETTSREVIYDIGFNFTDGNLIKKIFVDKLTQAQLINGRLAIARLLVDNNSEGEYAIIPASVADKIAQRDASSIVLHSALSAEEQDEDDPYADFKVPDDLMW